MFFRRKKARDSEPETPAADAGKGAASVPGSPTPAPLAGATTQFLTGETGRDSRTVQVLLEAIARIAGRVSEARDLESLLTDIVDNSVEMTGSERGLLVMRGPGGEGQQVRVARMRGRKPATGDLRYSTSIAQRVLDESQPLRAQVHSESEALELGRSVYDLKLRAVMCVPLAPQHGEGSAPQGVLYVDSRAATRQFTLQELSLFNMLAHHISIAITNARLQLDSLEKVRLEQSLELASAIQRDLMPRVPEAAGWDMQGWYGPAEKTAGDFYDFVRVSDGRLAVVVGDVTGHGIGPALITASAQGALRTSLRLNADPGQVVSMLNQDLCERIEDGRFLTLFLALLGQDGTVHALNAGHSPPFLWRHEGGAFEMVPKVGPALGMIPDESYRAHAPITMATGDLLVAYTDGLIEARRPGSEDDFFGEDGLRKLVQECGQAGLEAREVCARLVEAALEHAGGVREDDITVVVARRVKA
jgi:sigma-B regulation protein RsbU (phosphoserine phosphatase)